nr:L,D-transpeptidase family protein [Sphingomonas sp.]
MPARAVTPKAGQSELPASARQGRIFLTDAQLRQALISGTVDRPVKSLLAVQAPLQFGDYTWNDAAIPAGPTWVRVDLGSQLISVFRSGHEIGTAVIVYGGDNKETPVGTLHILAKARDHRSSLYEAEMPYTLRLTDDGVSIHASSVRWGAATHGCIGIPLAFAERLFAATHVGDDVVIVPATKTGAGQTS